MVGLAGFFWNKEPRRQADHAAADRDRWRAMLAAAPQPWCAWTDRGEGILSDGAAALLGVATADALNSDALADALAAPELGPALTRLRRDGEPFRCEARAPDGRRLVLSLTEEGLAVIDRNLATAAAVTDETLMPLTSGERMMLIELLRKIC